MKNVCVRIFANFSCKKILNRSFRNSWEDKDMASQKAETEDKNRRTSSLSCKAI